MGVETNIDYNRYPKQYTDSIGIGARVAVRYHYDTDKEPQLGTIVRCDAESPSRTIIKLDNGRFLLATECQFSIIDDTTEDSAANKVQTKNNHFRFFRAACSDELWDNLSSDDEFTYVLASSIHRGKNLSTYLNTLRSYKNFKLEGYANEFIAIPVSIYEQLIEMMEKEQEGEAPTKEHINDYINVYKCPKCGSVIYLTNSASSTIGNMSHYCKDCGSKLKWNTIN